MPTLSQCKKLQGYKGGRCRLSDPMTGPPPKTGANSAPVCVVCGHGRTLPGQTDQSFFSIAQSPSRGYGCKMNLSMPAETDRSLGEPEETLAAPRDRLLDAATRLFCRFGINSVGVDAIVEAAGTAKTTLYSSFGSKEGLVEAVLEREGRAWRTWFLAVPPGPRKSGSVASRRHSGSGSGGRISSAALS